MDCLRKDDKSGQATDNGAQENQHPVTAVVKEIPCDSAENILKPHQLNIAPIITSHDDIPAIHVPSKTVDNDTPPTAMQSHLLSSREWGMVCIRAVTFTPSSPIAFAPHIDTDFTAPSPPAASVASPDCPPIMPFGMHQGRPLNDLPAEYIHWICDEPSFLSGLKPHTQQVLSGLTDLGLVVLDLEGCPVPNPAGAIMPFGKYKGTPLSELPDEYVEWLCGEAGFFIDSNPVKRTLWRQLVWLGKVKERSPTKAAGKWAGVHRSSRPDLKGLRDQVEVLRKFIQEKLTRNT